MLMPTSYTTGYNQSQRRGFKKKQRGGASSSSRGSRPLKNEALIRSLLRTNKVTGTEALQVRLVVDKGAGNSPDTSIVTLQSAMEISAKLGVDLIEISLRQEVPVIKAIDFDRLMYEKKKKFKGSSGNGYGGGKGGGGGGSNKPTKQFKFRAGIADNDLGRKVQNMIKYVKKGHMCQVTITSSKFRLRQDQGAIQTTLQRVREILGDHVTEPKATKANEAGTFTTMKFEPNPAFIQRDMD